MAPTLEEPGRRHFSATCSQYRDYHDKLWAECSQDLKAFHAKMEALFDAAGMELRPKPTRAEFDADWAEKSKPQVPATLEEIIKTRIIGVAPGDQDVVLEDADWHVILASLTRSPAVAPGVPGVPAGVVRNYLAAVESRDKVESVFEDGEITLDQYSHRINLSQTAVRITRHALEDALDAALSPDAQAGAVGDSEDDLKHTPHSCMVWYYAALGDALRQNDVDRALTCRDRMMAAFKRLAAAGTSDAERDHSGDVAEMVDLREEVAYWRRDAAARLWNARTLLETHRRYGDDDKAMLRRDALRTTIAAVCEVSEKAWGEGDEITDDLHGQVALAQAALDADDATWTGNVPTPPDTPAPAAAQSPAAGVDLREAARAGYEALEVFANRTTTPGADKVSDDGTVTMFMGDCREAKSARDQLAVALDAPSSDRGGATDGSTPTDAGRRAIAGTDHEGGQNGT